MQVGIECFYREYVFINSFKIRCATIIVIIFSITLDLFGNNKVRCTITMKTMRQKAIQLTTENFK